MNSERDRVCRKHLILRVTPGGFLATRHTRAGQRGESGGTRMTSSELEYLCSSGNAWVARAANHGCPPASPNRPRNQRNPLNIVPYLLDHIAPYRMSGANIFYFLGRAHVSWSPPSRFLNGPWLLLTSAFAHSRVSGPKTE